MIIKINKKTILFSIGILLAAVMIISISLYFDNSSKIIVAGGKMHPCIHISSEVLSVTNQKLSDVSERFQRPSKQLPLSNSYSFQDFLKDDNEPPLIDKKFESPEDLMLAYYGILRYASNMLGYSGGCGSIGDGDLPYPYAYELFTEEKQKEMPLNQFIDSFKGIGYTTLLKLISAYTSPDTPQNISYYMAEIEVITGVKVNNDKDYDQGSSFAYYYGLLTVEKTAKDGFKIKDIAYIPENFLCAPMHSWFYLSDSVVEIVYGDNLKIVEKIEKIEQKADAVHIYASGNGRQYRFDFIRLSNGYDILLHENILENDIWKETSLLTDEWKDFKLTNQNSQLS